MVEGLSFCEANAFEIILVDDGSTDGSLNEFLSALPSGLHVKSDILETNRGPGTARNSGLAIAEGQFVAFWDADDRAALLPYMELAYTLAESDLLLGALGYEIQAPGRGTLQKFLPGSDSELCQLIVQRPAIWRFIFRRQGLADLHVRFPALRYGEDLLFMLEIAGRSGQLVATHSTLGYWHQLGRSGSTSTKPGSRGINMLLHELSRVLDDSTSPQLRALALQWFWRVWARGSVLTKAVACPALLAQTTKAGVRGYLYPSVRWAWESMAVRGSRDQSPTETTNAEWPQADV
jgi:hypothetical protein